MIKTLLVLVNIIGLTILNFLFLQKIDVTHNPPETLTPGSSEEVEVVISKGSVEGFAKFQLNVDNGLRIEAIESNGASFTFNDQKAKFIWMSLPEEKEIVVRYRLSMDSKAEGDKRIEGHFSYIDENQRLVYDIAPKVVSTGLTATASNDSEQDDSDNLNQEIQATAERSIEPGTDGRMLVELQINKGSLTGFAKIQEEISTDYTAVAVESKDAVFNIVDNTVKFVWFDIPADETFTVSYELIPVIDNPNVEFPIQGEFSYLLNNETQTVEIGEITPSTSIAETDEPKDEQEEQFVAENEEPEEQAEEKDEPLVEVDEGESWETDNLNNGEHSSEEESEKPDPATKEKDQPVAEETEDPKSAPVTSIAYSVQITAANKVVDKEYFKNMHKYSGGFDIEHHEGWIKYTTGSFAVYRAARDYRDELIQSYNFPGPFVTAYNEGERITVQEALMIANQKWVP